MLAFVLLVICSSACALPSTTITHDPVKIHIPSSKGLALPSGHRSDVVGIVGGNETTIDVHPYAVTILEAVNANTFTWHCCGTILNTLSVLTAGHCQGNPHSFEIRVGSSMALSGGATHHVESFLVHPEFIFSTSENDIAIVRSATSIVYTANAVQPAVIAGADYNLPDNETVWAVGWGATKIFGKQSNKLRHVQIWTINQEICSDRY